MIGFRVQGSGFRVPNLNPNAEQARTRRASRVAGFSCAVRSLCWRASSAEGVAGRLVLGGEPNPHPNLDPNPNPIPTPTPNPTLDRC